MKYLNKNYKYSELNNKLRRLYYVKQLINNEIPDRFPEKSIMMKLCDKLINKYWRASYKNIPGYRLRDTYEFNV